jgi:hypothetical protein
METLQKMKMKGNKKGKKKKKEYVICEQYTNACKLRWARL